VKQEPSDYSWTDFVGDGGTSWTGVRNFAARNNLRRMSKGDHVLFYHSGGPSRTGTDAEATKAVVGIAKVTRTVYKDPTAKDEDWSSVDLAPVKNCPARSPWLRSKRSRSSKISRSFDNRGCR